PGDPVLTQFAATMAFLQSASMSTRNVLRESAVASSRYAILKMTAKCGGFGATPQGAAARADITALGAFVFRSARMEDVKFDDANPRLDTEIENGVKTGLKS